MSNERSSLSANHSAPRDSKGWDGKLRIEKPGTDGDENEPSERERESEDEDAMEKEVDGNALEADEGNQSFAKHKSPKSLAAG